MVIVEITSRSLQCEGHTMKERKRKQEEEKVSTNTDKNTEMENGKKK